MTSIRRLVFLGVCCLALIFAGPAFGQDISTCMSPRVLGVSATVGAAPSQHVVMVDEGTRGCERQGSVLFTLSVDFMSGTGWLSVPPSVTFEPGRTSFTVTIIYGALPGPGVYEGQIIGSGGRSETFSISVAVTLNAPPPRPPTPILPPDSVVNGGSFRAATEPNSAIAPGAIVTIFGTDLASDTEVASEVPLPTMLGETSVTFNGIAAPLFFVSGTQINAQVPFELVAGAGLVMVQVTRGGETSTAQPIAIAAVSPGIFTQNEQGTGPGAILHAADFQPVTESNPAQTGEFLLIFCTGLGPVQPEVPSGNVAPGTEPLARTANTPMVNIGGIPAEVVYSGLAPGFVGLYQVNVKVPLGLSPPNEQPEGASPPVSHDLEIINIGVPSNIVEVPVGITPPTGVTHRLISPWAFVPAQYAQPRNHQQRCAEQHRHPRRAVVPFFASHAS